MADATIFSKAIAGDLLATDYLAAFAASGQERKLLLSSAKIALLNADTAAAQRAALGLDAELGYAFGDETSSHVVGTSVVKFRMPHAMTLTAVRISLGTAPTGSSFIVNLKESGTTVFSTKVSIDAGAKTSTTATTPAVISDASLADDAEMTVDIDQIGATIAGAGGKIYLIGTRA